MELSKLRIDTFLDTRKDILQPKPATIDEKIFWE